MSHLTELPDTKEIQQQRLERKNYFTRYILKTCQKLVLSEEYFAH
jgi:hypothetical protein